MSKLRLTVGYDAARDHYDVYAFSFDPEGGHHGFWWADDNGHFRRSKVKEGQAVAFPTVSLDPHAVAQFLGCMPAYGGLCIEFSGDQLVVERR